MKGANALGKLYECKCEWHFGIWLKEMKMTLWYAKWWLGLDFGLGNDARGWCMKFGIWKGWFPMVDIDFWVMQNEENLSRRQFGWYVSW